MPWDDSKNGLDRVKEIKRYITSTASSWERKKDQNPPVNIIWNGANEDAHKGALANWCGYKRGVCNGYHPIKKCYGIEDKKYIARNTLSDLVVNHFCLGATNPFKANELVWKDTYGRDTMETVEISVEWKSGHQPNGPTCEKYLHEIIDGCDTNSKGYNWKGGGQLIVGRGGETTYRITPLAVRQPPSDGPVGGCTIEYKVAHDQFRIWGASWLGSSFGKELHDELRGHGLGITAWHFDYKLDDDGSEWKARGSTTVFSEKRLQAAIKKVANFPGWEGLDCKQKVPKPHKPG